MPSRGARAARRRVGPRGMRDGPQRPGRHDAADAAYRWLRRARSGRTEAGRSSRPSRTPALTRTSARTSRSVPGTTGWCDRSRRCRAAVGRRCAARSTSSRPGSYRSGACPGPRASTASRRRTPSSRVPRASGRRSAAASSSPTCSVRSLESGRRCGTASVWPAGARGRLPAQAAALHGLVLSGVDRSGAWLRGRGPDRRPVGRVRRAGAGRAVRRGPAG